MHSLLTPLTHPLLIFKLQQHLPQVSTTARVKANPSKGGDFSCATQALRAALSAVSTSTAKPSCSLLKPGVSPVLPGNHINSSQHDVMTSLKHIAPKGLILDQGITIPHAFVTNLIGGNDLLHNTA